MKVEIYTPGLKVVWDNFVCTAKNGHFMFKRDYMDYHADRFKDFSLIFFNEKGNIIGLLPANLVNESRLISHQGLTFGGLILDPKCTAEDVLEIFNLLKSFLAKRNIRSFLYKCIPYIYFTQPSDEDRYALFINNAQLARRDISSSIYLANRGGYTKGRKWSINKAHKAGLVVSQTNDWPSFWNVLETTLQNQHSVAPVHSLAEIERLASCFPENVKLFVAKDGAKILGGTVVFVNRLVVHTQYMANSIEGREVGALDLVIDRLICEEYIEKKYFDFGVSNENNGLILNSGLISQKEGFGARAVAHDFYEMEIA